MLLVPAVVASMGGLTRHPTIRDGRSPVSLRQRLTALRPLSVSKQPSPEPSRSRGGAGHRLCHHGFAKSQPAPRPPVAGRRAGHSCFRCCTQLAVAMPQPKTANQRHRRRAEATPTTERRMKQVCAVGLQPFAGPVFSRNELVTESRYHVFVTTVQQFMESNDGR